MPPSGFPPFFHSFSLPKKQTKQTLGCLGTISSSLVILFNIRVQVAHEILALQILSVLLDEPTDDSVEIAAQFTKEVGQLLDVSCWELCVLCYMPCSWYTQ